MSVQTKQHSFKESDFCEFSGIRSFGKHLHVQFTPMHTYKNDSPSKPQFSTLTEKGQLTHYFRINARHLDERIKNIEAQNGIADESRKAYEAITQKPPEPR